MFIEKTELKSAQDTQQIRKELRTAIELAFEKEIDIAHIRMLMHIAKSNN